MKPSITIPYLPVTALFLMSVIMCSPMAVILLNPNCSSNNAIAKNNHNKHADERENQKTALTFGVYQSDKASVMYRNFRPVVEYLNQKLNQSLNQSIDINITIFKTYNDAINAITNGEVDFVRFGPSSYIAAKKRNPGIQLLAMELKKGKKTFTGMIVVRNDSHIKTLSDIKGQRFAFGDRKSTIGRYLAQCELINAGINGEDLLDFDFLGRHDTVAKALLMGDYDAGSIKEKTFHEYNKQNKLRVIRRFSNVTKPWLARKDLDPKLFTTLQQLLFKINDKGILANLGVSGFMKATESDYKPVQEAMQKAMQFSTNKR